MKKAEAENALAQEVFNAKSRPRKVKVPKSSSNPKYESCTTKNDPGNEDLSMESDINSDSSSNECAICHLSELDSDDSNAAFSTVDLNVLIICDGCEIVCHPHCVGKILLNVYDYNFVEN